MKNIVEYIDNWTQTYSPVTIYRNRKNDISFICNEEATLIVYIILLLTLTRISRIVVWTSTTFGQRITHGTLSSVITITRIAYLVICKKKCC